MPFRNRGPLRTRLEQLEPIPIEGAGTSFETPPQSALDKSMDTNAASFVQVDGLKL